MPVACHAGCFIDGQVIGADSPSPGNPCLACRLDRTSTAYTRGDDGVSCERVIALYNRPNELAPPWPLHGARRRRRDRRRDPRDARRGLRRPERARRARARRSRAGRTLAGPLVVPVDVNQDGRVDLVHYVGDQLHVSLGSGRRDRPFGCRRVIQTFSDGTLVGASDLDGDGMPDVLLGYPSGTVLRHLSR